VRPFARFFEGRHYFRIRSLGVGFFNSFAEFVEQSAFKVLGRGGLGGSLRGLNCARRVGFVGERGFGQYLDSGGNDLVGLSSKDTLNEKRGTRLQTHAARLILHVKMVDG
jgi:hypothetical protein